MACMQSCKSVQDINNWTHKSYSLELSYYKTWMIESLHENRILDKKLSHGFN